LRPLSGFFFATVWAGVIAININEYIYTGGFRFSFKLKDKRFSENYNSALLNSDIGYRRIMGENKFYFAITIDLILALIGIGSGKM